jgi:flavorubredoxin
MSEAIEISPNIYWIGVNDRTTDLFEGMWPIEEEGVTYNTYLVKDERKALIDLTRSLKGEELLDHVDDLTNIAELDYIVINHLEPDHSGVLKLFHRLAPRAKFVCTEKAETPFVHWPETMMTYEPDSQILFSCDAFGGYGAFQGTIFDDEFARADFYEREALRYYVNIVAKFSRMVLRAIDKLAAVPIQIIAPAHGLIWRNRPERIVELYQQWAQYAIEETEPEVTLLYATMYGNTESMMNAVARGISKAGVPVQIFDVSKTHVSYILPYLWTRRGVMVGAPTYEGHLFPAMAYVLTVADQKRIVNKKAAYFGSYGWHGGAQRMFTKMVEPLKWDIVDNFTFVGAPAREELEKGEAFGTRFAEAVKNG